MSVTPTQLSNRDRALLRAVAAGRCTVGGANGTPLTVDGYCFTDQFAGPRLTGAGLITTSGPLPAPAQLTPTGQAILRTTASR